MELTAVYKDEILDLYLSYTERGDAIKLLIKDLVFETKVVYPRRSNFKVRTKCECCGGVQKNKTAESDYKVAMAHYRTDQALRSEQFKYICMYDLSMRYGEKQADAGWDMAWSRGHSDGLHSVYDELVEIADLLSILKEY